MLDKTLTPSCIVQQLDHYVIGQDDAKKTVAVAVYLHYRKIERSRADDTPLTKSNVLLIGPTGTGKTLMCETLARILGVPFVTAEATSLAQTRFVNEEIEAMLQRLLDKAGGDVGRAQNGIVFIDEIDKLKATDSQPRSVSGESVQHALLKIMEGSPFRLSTGAVHRHHQHPVHLRRGVRRPGRDHVAVEQLRLHFHVRRATTRRSWTASMRASSRPISSPSG